MGTYQGLNDKKSLAFNIIVIKTILLAKHQVPYIDDDVVIRHHPRFQCTCGIKCNRREHRLETVLGTGREIIVGVAFPPSLNPPRRLRRSMDLVDFGDRLETHEV